MQAGRIWKLSVSGQFAERSSSTVTVVPIPAETDYPTAPYVLSHVANGTGAFKIGVTRLAIGQIMNVTISGRNNLDPRFYEATRMASCRFTGREVGFRAGLRLKITPDDRAAMTSGTAQDVQLKLDNGTRTMLLDLGDANKIHSYERRHPNGEFTYDLDCQNYWDAAAANDIICTIS
jgi:hypothetical protein